MMTDLPDRETPAQRPRPAPLADCLVGVVPIVWNNADLPDLTPLVPATTVLDEIARIGFDGCQTGVGFPEGARLRRELAARDLRLAEVYAAIPCGPDGPAPGALDAGRERLAALHAAGGEVLVAACGLAPEREPRAGRAGLDDTPRLPTGAIEALARVVETLGREARDLGCRLVFHQHAGTFVETPAELGRLMDLTDPATVGVCLDVGHYLVGGGDPVDAVERYGPRIAHVHLKDVAPGPLDRLRDGRTKGFLQALRERIFVELGGGILDVIGVLEALAGEGYRGWLMVEQDTTWNPPSESAAIGRHVLEFAIRGAARGRAA